MSQLTKIMSAGVTGTVYLGERTADGTAADDDANMIDAWTTDGDVVMAWLCDASRFRFNQHRSTRSKFLYRDGERVLDVAGAPVLVPIGTKVDQKVDSVARREHPHLAAVPSMVLQGQKEIEAKDWFAAAKRRRTNRAAGRPAGRMPSFRAAKHTDLTFSGWRHMGAAEFRRTGKRTGIVTINGRNPATKKGPAPRCAWKLQIKVRFSADTTIRDYTSIKVNWTRRTLAFTNAPLPIERKTTGRAGGIHMGVTHALADELGNFFDARDTTALELRRQAHQRRMAKSREVAKQQHRKFWESHRYQAHMTAAAALSAKITRIRVDYAQKVTTRIVRDCDLIVIEDLKLRNMTRSAKGTASKPGKNVRQKTGLKPGDGRRRAGPDPADPYLQGDPSGGAAHRGEPPEHQSAVPGMWTHRTGKSREPSGFPLHTVVVTPPTRTPTRRGTSSTTDSPNGPCSNKCCGQPNR